MFDVKEIRKKFPIYITHPDLVYLDNGATSLKPQAVLDKMYEYYSQYGVNIHRGVYRLSYQATDEYDIARQKIADFIHAKFEEIVFVKNVTEALNITAIMYAEKYIKENDVVITSELEHHSSLLPWIEICQKKHAILRYIPLDQEGRITIENFRKVLDDKVKVVAVNYVSNVLGYIAPIQEITELTHQAGGIVIVDAAQAIQHFEVDVKKLDCDFLAFSGHKMLGPTGIGVLYGKAKILKTLSPAFYGGDMNEEVFKDRVEVKDIPYRFEAGTPPIAEAIGLGRAVDFLMELGLDNIAEHEHKLHQYALSLLKDIDGITVYNKHADIGIISFNIDGVHPHDAATCFDEYGVCLRAGHHCAQLVSKWLGCSGTLRASLYLYNSFEDIDCFIEAVKNTINLFRKLEGGNHE